MEAELVTLWDCMQPVTQAAKESRISHQVINRCTSFFQIWQRNPSGKQVTQMKLFLSMVQTVYDDYTWIRRTSRNEGALYNDLLAYPNLRQGVATALGVNGAWDFAPIFVEGNLACLTLPKFLIFDSEGLRCSKKEMFDTLLCQIDGNWAVCAVGDRTTQTLLGSDFLAKFGRIK